MLYDEYREYKLLCDDDIDLSAAAITSYEDGSHEYRMDTIWYLIQDMKPVIGNTRIFGLLFQVARLVLITPHSNAGIERVYSLLNKNKREGSERNCLDVNNTLSSILAVKLDTPETTRPCYQMQPDDALIKSAKTQPTYTTMLIVAKTELTMETGVQILYVGICSVILFVNSV